jgi:acetyl-CoA/propionyl-CoA carboxylase biotin carboxyl carrier protein
MEQPITAHRSGVIRGLAAKPGDAVSSGQELCEIVDPD